ARLGAIAAAVELAARARQATFAAAAAEELARLRAEEVETATAAAELAGELHAAGNLPELELLTHQAAHEEAVLARDAAELEAARARAELVEVLGLPADTDGVTLARLPEVGATAPTIEALEDDAVAASLVLAQA